MSEKKSKLELAEEQKEKLVNEINKKICELGKNADRICNELNSLQQLFDAIRNVPNEKRLEYERLKEIRLNWKKQAGKIESDYKNTRVKNAGKGAAGVGAGVAVAALGPTAAMGIATTFGVASTGTAISTLSGAAATNAALAWLGGGALAAGGGGMAAGNALLALAGPIGWTIAGVAIISSGLLLWKKKNDKERLKNILTLMNERDIKSYKLAKVEIKERISRIINESQYITTAIEQTKSFGLDYDLMTEEQQCKLGTYVNLMNASTQLLINPIIGLQPKYGELDIEEYISLHKKNFNKREKYVIASLANILYKIDMDNKDKYILWKYLKDNKEFLASIGIKETEFEFSIIETASDALNDKYHRNTLITRCLSI